MSTFNGLVAEFPEIRIDYFRTIPGETPPLACFLSHVHSDHLQGLESLKAPFIYCSQATRELLLKLEKYPHRMNFAKGILEARVQTYKHLDQLLKPIPLETPTTIELSPNNHLRVTLFDANHCPGAVMFLIEGNNKAILYTGDVRAEFWWRSKLAQSPLIIPYIARQKTLDRIYLDTTFAVQEDTYRHFVTKCASIQELLDKVKKYPSDTVFHFDTWTLGYEDVWIALSSALNCPIHVDHYRYELYHSLDKTVALAPALCGFQFGNSYHRGCLAEHPSTRIHSCERGTPCQILEDNQKVVRIVPIVARSLDGTNVKEQGVGSAASALQQDCELEITDAESVGKMMSICASTIQDPMKLQKVLGLLVDAIPEPAATGSTSPKQTIVKLHGAEKMAGLTAQDNMTLESLVSVLVDIAEARENVVRGDTSTQFWIKPTSYDRIRGSNETELPAVITFPYSRHSSYSELCELVHMFEPRSVFPCTVDEKAWTPEKSMRNLFGEFCSSDTFEHDDMMLRKFRGQRATVRGGHHESQNTGASSASLGERMDVTAAQPISTGGMHGIQKSPYSCYLPTRPSTGPSVEYHLISRQQAYNSAIGKDGTDWLSGVGLMSTGGSLRDKDQEL